MNTTLGSSLLMLKLSFESKIKTGRKDPISDEFLRKFVTKIDAIAFFNAVKKANKLF